MNKPCCPKCNSGNISRERRPNGNDICGNCHHIWPSIETHNAMKSKKTEYRPCPFCGSEDTLGLQTNIAEGKAYVTCFTCDAQGPVSTLKWLSENEAVAKSMWNKRQARRSGE